MKLKRKIFYGWVIVGITFLTMSVTYAIWFSFPLFYVAILNEFGWSRAETALIFSIGSIVYGIGSAIAGALLDRFGPKKTFTVGAVVMVIGVVGCSWATQIWQFFLFWGGLTAFGVCMAGFTPSNALVSNWFIKRRTTAVGITQAGGRESFIMTPLVQLLIAALGWRNTFLVLAAVAAIVIIGLAQFLRHSPKDMGLLPDGETEADEKGETGQRREDRFAVNKEWAATDWTLLRGMKKYRFWALFCSSFAIGAGYSIVMIHQVAFVIDVGFTAIFASFLLLIFGISSVVGRLCGFVADITGREIAYTLGCSGVILSFFMLIITKDPSTAWTLYIYAVGFGLFSGLNGPVSITAAVDIFQGRHLGAILGFVNLGYGLGNAIGSWLGGYVFDTVGNYIPAFAIAMFMLALAGISLWVASPRKIRAVGRRALKMARV